MAATQTQIAIQLVADAGAAIKALRSVGGGVENINKALVQATNAQFKWNEGWGRFQEGNKGVVPAANVLRVAVDNLKREQQEYREALRQATSGLSDQEIQMLQSAGVIKNMNHATGSAQFAAISLGQTFQDMGQFGMGAAQGVRAITNNVQQFTQSMVMLSGQIGPNENAFKALLTQLKGPVGFLAIFSLATAAVEFFSNRMQRARKEVEDTTGAFAELAEVIPTDNVRQFLVTQMSLEKRLAAARAEFETLRKQAELEKMSAGFGQMALAGESAGKRTEELGLEIDKLTKALEDVNSEGPKYVAWLRSVEGMSALSSKTAQDLASEIAELEAQLAMSGEFSQYEDRIASLKDAIEAGVGFDIKDPDAAIAELNRRFEDFTQKLRAINPELEVTREKFAELAGAGRVEAFLSAQEQKVLEKRLKENAARYRDYVRRVISEAKTLEREWSKILGPDGKLSNIDRATPLPRGDDGLVRGPEKLAPPTWMDAWREKGEEYTEQQNKIIDANQRIRESFADMGGDLIASFATIGGGLDSMRKHFGSFLMRFGREAIKMGLLTVLLGRAMDGIRDALTNLRGEKAIATGLALIAGGAVAVAAGSALRAQGKRSAAALSGRGGSGGYGVTRASFGDYRPFSNREEFLAGGLGAQLMPGRTPNRDWGRVDFRISGRDLVGAVDRTRSADTRMGIG